MAELDVHMSGRKVAVLDGSDPRNLTLTYDEGWLEDAAATPLSVSMPLRRGRHPHSVVHPYMWGLLPDNELVIERWAREYRCSSRSVFALLAHVGTDVAGAAQYLEPGSSAEESQEATFDPLDEEGVAQLLAAVREDSSAWHPRAGAGRWSLAGAQGKLALAHDSATGRWGVPGGSAPTTHILKPAIPGMVDHDLNEHICLATADRLGLRSATTEVASFGSERALVVSRYDRRMGGGRVVRVHQEDFCQAIGVHPQRKYQNDGGPGVGEMVQVLRDAVDHDADGEVERLILAVAYSWFVLGTDAHAKNYSLLLSGHQVRLAPLYDVASALPYGDHPRKLRMAQKVGGEHRPTVITGRHWHRVVLDAGLDPVALHDKIAALARDLPDAMSDAISTSTLTEGEQASARTLLDGITAWVSTCRSGLAASPPS